MGGLCAAYFGWRNAVYKMEEVKSISEARDGHIMRIWNYRYGDSTSIDIVSDDSKEVRVR